MTHADSEFYPISMAVLTISDSRNESNDTSGGFLCEAIEQAGHQLAEYRLVDDDLYRIRAVLSAWIAAATPRVIVTTGGTGYRSRDVTPDAIQPLFDREIVGFGELFRAISEREIGSSTVQSRALAGIANGTLIFALPGSTGACKTAWQKILCEQLDARHAPCNFAELAGYKV